MTTNTKETWTIEITEKGIFFTKNCNNQPCESYPLVNKEKAAIYAISIINGFQPPRNLSRSCTQTG